MQAQSKFGRGWHLALRAMHACEDGVRAIKDHWAFQTFAAIVTMFIMAAIMLAVFVQPVIAE